MAADVDAPDRVAFDLTFRQVSVLTVAGLTGLIVWAGLARLAPMLPAAVRAVVLLPIAGVALALAVGRRDGLPLDAWLTHAGLFRTRPGRLTSTQVHEPPGWAPTPPSATGRRREPAMGLLRLPADAVDADGTIRYRDRQTTRATVLVAASTVNIRLRTATEQAALVAGFGRWLNGLTSGVQIVVTTRRVDLPGHALRLLEQAHRLTTGQHDGTDPDPEDLSDGALDGLPGLDGLAAAAIDHAEFLLDLSSCCDPLERMVIIAATAVGGPSPATVARRAGEHTVTALSGLGAQTQILDGATATAVLVAGGDPYQASNPGWPRTRPGAVVTAGPTRSIGAGVDR
jgi:hypothetical protein